MPTVLCILRFRANHLWLYSIVRIITLSEHAQSFHDNLKSLRTRRVHKSGRYAPGESLQERVKRYYIVMTNTTQSFTRPTWTRVKTQNKAVFCRLLGFSLQMEECVWGESTLSTQKLLLIVWFALQVQTGRLLQVMNQKHKHTKAKQNTLREELSRCEEDRHGCWDEQQKRVRTIINTNRQKNNFFSEFVCRCERCVRTWVWIFFCVLFCVI